MKRFTSVTITEACKDRHGVIVTMEHVNEGVRMGFFDRFRKKRKEAPGKAETSAFGSRQEAPIEDPHDVSVTNEPSESFGFLDFSNLSDSLSFTITKDSVREGMTMTTASLDDAAERRQSAITNERIRKHDVILETYVVESDAISGGMGSVWRVRHTGWGAELAMKRPQPRFFAEASEARKANFIAECEYWINLGLHPNIVSCYYVREVGGVPTIFSEWMGAGSLKDAIESGTLYEGDADIVQERILDIAIQATRGLAYSHERDLLHQDVKPANILLTAGWDAKVADFGLAKAASKLQDSNVSKAAHSTGYTLAYCPAEQAQGAEPAPWMDVYAWALTVLEMYAGERMWQTGSEAKDTMEECFAQCRIPLPGRVQKLIGRCLTDRVDGFASIDRELVEIYCATIGGTYPRDASKAATDVADVLNNRALSMLDLGKVDEAEELWEQALEADPTHLASTYNQALHEWRNSYIDDVEAQRRVNVLMDPRADELADRLRHDVGRPADILENFDLRSTEQIISEQAEQAVNASKPTKAVYMMPCPNDERRVLAACDYWMEIVDAESGHSFVQFDMGAHPENGILTSPVIDEEGRIVVRAHSGLWFEWNAYAANREALDAISAATEPIVYVWDMQTGKCIRQLRGHEKRVRAVAIDKRGRTVYSAGEDKTLKVWNVDSGTCTGSFPLEEEVRSLAIDDNDEQLLIGTMLGNIIVWSIPDECDVGFLEGHDGEVDALAFGRDGVHALSNSKDSRRFWDVPDERCLMTSDGGGDTWMLCGRFPFGAVSREQVSTLPDDGRPAEWELSVVQSTAEALAFETAFNQALSEARASLEARDISAVLEHISVARSCHGFENDPRLDELIRQIDSLCVKKGIRGITEIEEVPINCDGAQALHVTADGRHAIAVARYELVVWSMEHKRAIATLRSDEIFDWEDEWGSLYPSADGSRVLCSTYRAYPNKCLILDFTGDELRTKTGSICSPSSAEFEELSATKPLSVDPSLSTAAYNYKDKTFAVDLATGESKLLLDFSVDWVRISPDNAYMLYEVWRYDGSGDIKAFVANPFHTGAAERRFAENLGDLDVLAFDGDWKKALTATEDKHLAITSMETGEQIIALDFNGSYSDHCPEFTSDERFVFISNYDGRLFIFEPETGECVYELDTQENIVTFVLGNDMHMLYVLNNKGNMRTWRVEYDYEWRGPEQALTPESSTKSEPTSEAE